MFNDPLSSRIDELCNNSESLHYIDPHGTQIRISVQPRAVIEQTNANPATVAKLKKNGVSNCLVIGNDEFGLPLVIAIDNLKTYLLESDEMEKDEYLDYEITVRLQ
jgi:hypothetical protein